MPDLRELTAAEAAAYLARGAPVVVPLGSLEQHGPHLPLGTDIFAAAALAEAVAHRLGGLVFAPTPLGVTPLHRSLPVTLSLRPETLSALLVEVGEGLSRHGLRRLVALNWHEGNIPALDIAMQELVARTDLDVVVVQACYVAQELWGERAGGLTHGGELEVLPLLTSVPELVHLERATDPSSRDHGAALDRARRSRSIYPVLRDVRQLAPTGWYGEPGRATPEKASAFLEEVAGEIARRVAETFAVLERLPDPRRTGGAEKD